MATTTVRSSNAKGRPTAPKSDAKIDEYGFVFICNGSPVNTAATLDDRETSKGKAYYRVNGANGFTQSAVLNLPSLPTDIAVVGFSKGIGVKVYGKVHGKSVKDGTAVQFDGMLTEALPNGSNRINAVRVAKSQTGYSIWAMCGHFIASWSRGQAAASNKSGTTVQFAEGLTL